MDLFVTWDGLTGDGILYVLEYRPYPAGGAWTVINNISNTYYNLTDLIEQFYEIRVKTDCADSDSNYEYQIQGKEPCPLLEYVSYSILSENDLQQIIRIIFTNNTNSVRVKVTNLNTSAVVLEELRVVAGFTDLILSKFAGQSTAYKVEIANICSGVPEIYIDMGTYNVVGPPAEIGSNLYMYSDFTSSNNCAPSNFDWNNKPATGTRLDFAEPLPQAVTIVFRACFNTVNGYVCSDNRPAPFQDDYYQITIPAGTSTWAASHFRISPTYSIDLCIVSITPAVFNNGKKLKFRNVSNCTSFNPSLPHSNLNQFPNMPNPPCINGST